MKKIALSLMATLLVGCNEYNAREEIQVYKECLAAGMKAKADSYTGKIICIPSDQITSLTDLKRKLRAKEIEIE